jgi:hypothetical protein
MWRPANVVSKHRMSWVFPRRKNTTARTKSINLVTFPRWARHSYQLATKRKELAEGEDGVWTETENGEQRMCIEYQ